MKSSSINYNILVAISILLVLGVLCIADVSAPFSQKVYGNTYSIFLKHLASVLVGLFGGFLAFKVPIDFFKKNAEYITLATVILMLIVFIPGIGIKAGGASRWINLGFTSIQPSEFFKLAFIIFLAKKLTTNRIRSYGDFIRIFFVFFLLIIQILVQKDMSTLMVLSAIFLVMYFLSDAPWQHSFLMVLIGIIGIFILIKFEPYRLQRVELFLNPDLDPMGAGWQQKQSLISIGSGGITGLGLGLSKQKMGFLPQPMTDSIFAIVCEQLGFIGAIAILFLYLYFMLQGFNIAKKSRSEFMRLVSFGIVIWIIGQAFVNISSAIGLFPITGLPLPFVSMGGSSLIAGLTAVGLLLNISKQI
ncbi:MAG TPA: putative lipid II flippase FtsW [Candidatus Pacearchaeota archaeon]|nr:putative lipid II flippase FtsW [Candidatus Pacearchaeota archaeon]